MTGRKLRSVLILASSVALLALTAGGARLEATADDQRGRSQSSGQRGSSARVPGPGTWEWWKDEGVQKELGLTAEKRAQLDSLYRERSARMAAFVKRWQREQASLDQMTRAAEVDEATYAQQVATVELHRSEIIKGRTVMHYRMFRELTPAQHRKLQDIFARIRANRPSGPGTWEWWNDEKVQKDLGLTSEKAAQIDSLYRERSAQVAPFVEGLQREQAVLGQMTRAAAVDESTYTQQVARVELYRSEITKSRTVMLYRMFRELTPEQHRTLQDIFARIRASRDRGRS